jgi:hypothetical protein
MADSSTADQNQSNSQQEQWMSLRQFVGAVGITMRTGIKMCHEGRIKADHVPAGDGFQWRIKPAELLRYLQHGPREAVRQWNFPSVDKANKAKRPKRQALVEQGSKKRITFRTG